MKRRFANLDTLEDISLDSGTEPVNDRKVVGGEKKVWHFLLEGWTFAIFHALLTTWLMAVTQGHAFSVINMLYLLIVGLVLFPYVFYLNHRLYRHVTRQFSARDERDNVGKGDVL